MAYQSFPDIAVIGLLKHVSQEYDVIGFYKFLKIICCITISNKVEIFIEINFLLSNDFEFCNHTLESLL